MAAPTFVAAGALFAAASGTSITPVIPGDATTNDIMLMAVMSNASNTFTTPSDWTLLGTSAESDVNQSTEWYWKRHDGSESDPTSTVGTSLSAFIGGYGRIYVFRGCVTTGDPFEDVTMAGSPSNTSTPATATITTTAADRLAVCLVMVDDDNTWSSGNPPSGWTAIGRVASTTGGDCMMDGIYQTIASAGDVTAVNVGTMSASDYWRTLTLALIPAGGSSVSGVATGSFGFTATTAGVPETFGVAIGSFTYTATAAGVDRALGLAVASLGFTGTASGTTATIVQGQALGAFSFTATALGIDRALGQAVAPFIFTGTTSGQPRHLGVSVGSFGFSGSASGTTGAELGQAVASFGFIATTLGQPRTKGAAATTLSFNGTAAGVDRALGAAVASLGFSGAANGVVDQPPVLGAAVGVFGFTATASGRDRALGVAVGAVGFSASASGKDRALGRAVISFGFTTHIMGNSPVYLFIPPTHEEPIRSGIKPLGYFRLTHSTTVFRRNGTFVSMRSPTPEVLAEAGVLGEDYFIGGYEYHIGKAVRDELVAAGYSVQEA